ncbi:mycocerosate synthase [Mycobacteroides abscessus subsp. abscessus]|nr:mycocerosate synthase [Mycobacteroides abscessus subsp. abscessus]
MRAVANGECDVALAGGVNVMFQPETFITMCKGRFLAADGRSKSFDAAADGYGRGEGVGIVVLKNLEQAQRDGDHIYAVIRGIRQGGRAGAAVGDRFGEEQFRAYRGRGGSRGLDQGRADRAAPHHRTAGRAGQAQSRNPV